MLIDISFDFTSDTPGYWDNFWNNRNGLGLGSRDPDTDSKTLQRYHQLLWSRKLPCGKEMKLNRGCGSYYLTWEDFRFASDTIIVDFRNLKYRKMLEKIWATMPDYRAFVEETVHKAYTIGGTIIFPKHTNSINQRKGTHPMISDRWDLTLECIRRYYAGEESPLSVVLEADYEFFKLFKNFKGYVDYFFLQDCVTDDYKSVNIWLGDGSFTISPLPKTANEYFLWLQRQEVFLNKRNNRIRKWAEDIYE